MISLKLYPLIGVKVTDVCSGIYLLETEEATKCSLQETEFNVEIGLAAQSAYMQELTEVPIDYRPRIGPRKLNTWRDGRAVLSAAFRLAWRYNPVFLYSCLATLSIVPTGSILLWVLWEHLAKHVWHPGMAFFGAVLFSVAAQAFTLMSISIMTKHGERRLLREMKLSTTRS